MNDLQTEIRQQAIRRMRQRIERAERPRWWDVLAEDFWTFIAFTGLVVFMVAVFWLAGMV